MAENQSKATPARVLLLFTLLFAGVVAAAWREAGQRGQMESVDYPTALGDSELCPVSLLKKGASFTANLDGQKEVVTLEIISTKARVRSEERLWKAGKDSSGAFYIYQQEPSAATTYWVKSGADHYYEAKLKGPASLTALK